jgi:glucosamine-6-phosphate deaminase
MRERVELRVRPKIFHYLQGDALLPLDECKRYADLLAAQPIDLCCLGIGENGISPLTIRLWRTSMIHIL